MERYGLNIWASQLHHQGCELRDDEVFNAAGRLVARVTAIKLKPGRVIEVCLEVLPAIDWVECSINIGAPDQ